MNRQVCQSVHGGMRGSGRADVCRGGLPACSIAMHFAIFRATGLMLR